MEILERVKSGSKFFLDISLSEHEEIFKGDLRVDNREYIVPEEIIESICKQSGISASVNKILRATNIQTWIDTVITLYKYYYPEGRVYFLVNNSEVVGVTFNSIKPLLNTEFFSESNSLLSDYEDILTVDSIRYDKEDINSEILLFHKDLYEYKGQEYQVGILLKNSELSKVTCTLVVSCDDVIFYLPKKYCNLTSSRYSRTSSDSIEAYKLLLLRIVEDMSDERWFSIVNEIHNHVQNCKVLPVTYEEYRRVVRLLNRVSILSDMDEEEISSIIEDLESKFFDFEENYPALEEKKGSYIWRCSALSESNIYYLIESLQSIINTHAFYPEVLIDIRSTLGDFLVLNKISTELATKVGGARGV